MSSNVITQLKLSRDDRASIEAACAKAGISEEEFWSRAMGLMVHYIDTVKAGGAIKHHRADGSEGIVSWPL